jgi:hypothetical protein
VREDAPPARQPPSDAVTAQLPAPFVPSVRDGKDTSNFDDYPESDSESSAPGGRAGGGTGDSAGKLAPKDAELFLEFDSY